MTNRLWVKHNMEVAHRLSALPGKCQQIHGHSMQVKLTLVGLTLNANGIAGGVDFGRLKKLFRGHIDAKYDHHLHLNQADASEPWMGSMLPGVVLHSSDPTVENLAVWIASEMFSIIRSNSLISGWVPDDAYLRIDIDETQTNGASWKVLLNASL